MTKTDRERQRKAPILRFKGFTDAWEQRKLGTITDTYSGGTPQVSVKDYYSNNEIPFIRSSDIHKNKTELYISSKGLENSSAKLVSKGHILYALYGATSGEVDVSKIDGAINQAVLCINAHNDLNYFLMLFLSKNKDKIVRKYIQGGQGNLSASIVKKIKVFTTSKLEETKISNLVKILSDIITLYDRKLKLLSQVKKYFLDNLFAEKEYPNLRFKYFKKDKWEKTSLNSIVTYSNGKAHEKEINNKGNLNLVMMNSITTGGRLITKKRILSPQDTLNKNDIVIVLSDIAKGELIGKSSVIPCDNQYVLNQRIGCLHPTLNIDSFFVSKYINQKNRYFKSHAAGTSQINLSKSDVLNCTIYIPKVDEQHYVSNFIINVEKIINFYEYKKRHIIQIKNTLLNTMFI